MTTPSILENDKLYKKMITSSQMVTKQIIVDNLATNMKKYYQLYMEHPCNPHYFEHVAV